MPNATKMNLPIPSLLSDGDPYPVMLSCSEASATMVICCDHAGNSVPKNLHMLGIDQSSLENHIGLDIGVFSTSHWLAHALNAPLIGQAYSRLVIDCNRRPDTPQSIPVISDGVPISGNEALEQSGRTERKNEIFQPYHQELANLLQQCGERTGHTPSLLSMHSFTRSFNGDTRPWDLGIIYGDTSEIGDRVFHSLRGCNELNIGYNVPYQIDFDNDYTLPVHAVNTERPYVEIEVCQDIISTCEGQRRLARILAPVFAQVLAEMRIT